MSNGVKYKYNFYNIKKEVKVGEWSEGKRIRWLESNE